LLAHQDWITSLLRISDEKIASGSHDKTIKIWNWVEGICEKQLSD